MNENEFLTQQFETHRSHLRGVAYRMLGSLSEADDAVQETWVRLSRTDADEVENLGGWLTTVVGRVALNMLRSRRTRREEPFDERMPEPIVDRADGTDPEHEALLGDSLGVAMLIVLETLKPAERLAFVLHDMFAVPFEEIAPIVDRSPAATRQLASRARRRVQGQPVTPDADLDTQREVLGAFLTASREGNFEALLADAVGLALLVVLDTLPSAERLAFVLHDMFAVPFDEIAGSVGRTPTATRQLASRARRRVRGDVPIPEPDLARQREVVDAVFAAARDGDFDALVAVLDPDVILRSDGGPRRPGQTIILHGPDAVAARAMSFAHGARHARPGA